MGILPKSYFPDVSQGLISYAGLSKDSTGKPPWLTALRTGAKMGNYNRPETRPEIDLSTSGHPTNDKAWHCDRAEIRFLIILNK